MGMEGLYDSIENVQNVGLGVNFSFLKISVSLFIFFLLKRFLALMLIKLIPMVIM